MFYLSAISVLLIEINHINNIKESKGGGDLLPNDKLAM